MGRFEFTQGITSTPGATLTQFNSYAAFLLGLPQTMRTIGSVRNDDGL